MDDPDVLIVGGGPIGLTLAIELGQLGIRTELVDKRPRPGRLPKMERCNARTMEHFRRMGIADRIPRRGPARRCSDGRLHLRGRPHPAAACPACLSFGRRAQGGGPSGQ